MKINPIKWKEGGFMVKEIKKIIYSDVCKDNKVYDQLKEFMDLEPKEHELSYGYMYANIEGVKFSVNVDRHQTHAGNQYIKIYPDNYYHEQFKIPLNVEIDIIRIKDKLKKIAEQVKKEEIERNQKQEYRSRVYAKFSQINKNDRIKLNIDSKGEIQVNGIYSRYYNASVSYEHIEKDIEEIRKYFKNYEKEQKEIEIILTALKTVK